MPSDLISQYQPSPDALKGKTILITGAAGGLGASIARSAARLGSELILLDHNERGLNAIHDEIEGITGTQPGLYPLDLAGANIDDYHQMADTIKDVFGKLDGLVHCAANLGQITPVLNIDATLWQKTFTVNLHAPLLLTQAVMPLMRSTGGSRIIFTVDDKRKAYWGAYSVSKTALEGFIKTMSDELDADRDTQKTMLITCNGVDPGKMRTSLRSSAFPGEDPSTLPDPADKVSAFLYLLSAVSADVNGQIFSLG